MGASGLLALLFLAAGTPGVEPAQPKSLAITGVTIIDMTGGPARRDRTVVIRGGRIASIEPDSGGAAIVGARRIRARGKFLIPGLWDMHVHLSWSKGSALPVLVANGITGVRDMGGSLPEIDAWRTLISAGILRGPRIFRVGPILNGQKFNAYQMVTGNPDETRGVARALKEAGVDFLKVHRRMPRDSYFALIDEAKHLGLSVVGHIPMTVTPEEASDAGQATLEHTETLFEGLHRRVERRETGRRDPAIPRRGGREALRAVRREPHRRDADSAPTARTSRASIRRCRPIRTCGTSLNPFGRKRRRRRRRRRRRSSPS